jgi:EAL domain-containing protein (putative c-di-GMP-specific phosphodiesterase class I)
MAGQGISEAIIVDERGVTSAMWGARILRSAFQPVFAVASGRIEPVAQEALVRCFAGQRSVPVARFFAGIEPPSRLCVEGLIHELHVRNAAACLPVTTSIFVNFDPSLFCGPAEVRASLARIDDLVRALGIAPGRLFCEITEQECASDDALGAFVAAVRDHGFQVAVDDFGAQSSDMRRVAQLRPDIVKLDQRWLWRLMDTRPGRALIAHMAGEFTALGIATVFEGIEHGWQLDVAVACGAGMVQGFALAHPALAGDEPMLPGLASPVWTPEPRVASAR